MRLSLRERRFEHKLHRSFPVPRLATMFIMLAIIGLVFMQLRNPNNFRYFASAGEHQTVRDALAIGSGQAAHSADSSRNSGETPKTETPSPEPSKGSAAVAAEPPGHPLAGRGTPAQAPPEGGTTNTEPPKDSAAPPKGASILDTPLELTPTGRTDADPGEREDIEPILKYIQDGSLWTVRDEQPAYFQVLGWVDHQPLPLLQKRATRAFFYDTLVNSPKTMRLQLVEVTLNVKQIVPCVSANKEGKLEPILSPDDKPLFEVRGVSQESGTDLYFGMVTDLPPNMPIGADGSLNEDAVLIGYFFKVQGYYSRQQQIQIEASGKPAKPHKAPLILGRLIWQPSPITASATKTTPVWVIATIGGIGIIVVVGWVYWSSRRRTSVPRITITSSGDPDAPAFDNWLDDAQAGRGKYEDDEKTPRFGLFRGWRIRPGFQESLFGEYFRRF